MNKKFTIVHFGKYIPLHGLEYVIKAAKLLENHGVFFRLIGSGQEYAGIRALAESLSLNNVEFISFVTQDKLKDYIMTADICLGIFGETMKAKRVIPNKIYECIAMCKPVITGASPAIRELFAHKENIFLCDMADKHALAESILYLKENEKLRRIIAHNAYSLYNTRLTVTNIGKEVSGIIKELCYG